MTEAEWVAVGRVGRPHGLAGAFFVERPASRRSGSRRARSSTSGASRPTIVEAKHSGGRPVIRLDRPADRGLELLVPRTELPPPEEDSYYVFQLDRPARRRGRAAARSAPCRTWSRAIANDVLVLDSGLRLPLVDACVRKVDLEAGTIEIAPGFAGDG